VYLKRLTLNGFKSFGERTVLELGPGVSVIVGPNGSGKSNITDAILWALGEQSPSAIRSGSMQEVIFAGGPAAPACPRAEVELVLDNSRGEVELPVSELAICRRLGRDGEAEYLLNGARCTLTEIHELLSDTGLGKEAHSVVSQGRIEAVVLARPPERRALLEEAAGLAKYRRRRQRAQRKLERAAENLARALDVEQEARARLRPLHRQAQAADLSQRLARQLAEAKLALVCSQLAEQRQQLARTQTELAAARRDRAELEQQLAEVLVRREQAEQALGERSTSREQAAALHHGLRSALERAALRGEQLGAQGRSLTRAAAELERRLVELSEGPGGVEQERERLRGRIAELERRLGGLAQQSEVERSQRRAELERRQAELAARVDQAKARLAEARAASDRGRRAVEAERKGELWQRSWTELRAVLAEGLRRLATIEPEVERERELELLLGRCESLARAAVEHALGKVGAAERALAQAQEEVRAAERELGALGEQGRRLEQELAELERSNGGEAALAAAAVEGELASERRVLDRFERELARRQGAVAAAQQRLQLLRSLDPLLARALAALTALAQAGERHVGEAERQARGEREAAAALAANLRECAQQEAALQGRLGEAADLLTRCELAFQRSAERVAQLEREELSLVGELGEAQPQEVRGLDEQERAAIEGRIARLERRLAAIGPINPLAAEEYEQAKAHVEELERQRADLEAAMRELKGVIREADRKIKERFSETFEAVARHFEEVVGEIFPGASGRLVLVEPEEPEEGEGAGEQPQEAAPGVEIELRHAGRAAKRLSLLSGGEKSMTALAFLFSVFLARPCPFYVLDEVEAALDDLNLERFIRLLRRCAAGAQFIVVTHQRRTMEAADWLFGVSMGKDGLSKVLSRRMDQHSQPQLAPAS